MNKITDKIRLSEHFSLGEFTYSRIAVEHACDNEPPVAARQSLVNLVTCLLEPLRQLYGAPIAILSGYRSEVVNRLAGGVETSQHRKGEAADCYIPEGPRFLLDLLIKSGLLFDQAILYRQKHFLHLSYKRSGRNRMQILICMLCVICLCTGCKSRVRDDGMSRQTYADTVGWNSREVGSRADYSSVIDSLYWELEQVTYLPPDSSGMQYIESVLTVRAQQSHFSQDSVSVVVDNRSDFSRKSGEEMTTRIIGKGPAPDYFLWSGSLFLVVLLSIWVIRRSPLVRN